MAQLAREFGGAVRAAEAIPALKPPAAAGVRIVVPAGLTVIPAEIVGDKGGGSVIRIKVVAGRVAVAVGPFGTQATAAHVLVDAHEYFRVGLGEIVCLYGDDAGTSDVQISEME